MSISWTVCEQSAALASAFFLFISSNFFFLSANFLFLSKSYLIFRDIGKVGSGFPDFFRLALDMTVL